MKTTIEINDVLLQQTKRFAAERNLTMRAIVEAALRQFLGSTAAGGRGQFRLRKHSFRGQGLQPGLNEHDWTVIRERAYEGRGG